MTTRWSMTFLIVALGLTATSKVEAGGFYFTDRGARQLARGYAFVAGADDAQALWYNPAGLAFADHQLYIDASMILLHAEYTRVDTGGNQLPTVRGTNEPLPLPTLAYVNDFNLDDFTFSLGMLTPSGLVLNWPEQIQVGQSSMPAPQRYSLISMRGTLFGDVVLAAAWQPIPELSIGVAGHLIFGHFRGLVVTSGCDNVICAQPENPEYDALHEIEQHMAVTATAGVGVIYNAPRVRVGVSAMIPFRLASEADLRAQLPSAALFDNARIEGDSLRMALEFPLVLRAGVEVRPIPNLRLETSFVYERWSTQKSIAFDIQDVWIRNIATIGDYQVGDVEIPRHMNDVYSVRFGGEYTLPSGRVVLRSGLMYESSSFDDAYLTPLTIDTAKVILGFGVGVMVSRGIVLDISYGHVFGFDRDVTNSQVPVPNSIRPSAAPEHTAYAGNGHYEIEADVLALGLTWNIDETRGERNQE